MEIYAIIIAIFLPILSAILCIAIKNKIFRNTIVVFSAVIMFVVAVYFVFLIKQNVRCIVINSSFFHSLIDLSLVIKILDFVLLAYILFVGIKLKKLLIVLLTIIQALILGAFELFGGIKEPESVFVIDHLSLIMILLVSVIGPIITIFAIGYMKEHEHHLGLKISRQPRFFAVLFLFLGAMNALAMTDNMLWLYFFWEITTLCSFLLISHDKNQESVNNAIRALWINSLGGVAFIIGIVLIYKATGTLSILQILDESYLYEGYGLGKGVLSFFPIGLGMLCFAGFTKAAQFPFQSWLLGAMVAPTPVSALLHSSTMVKAGVYIIVRMAPAFSDSSLGKIVAVVGGFTFVAGSALAISQRNAKRVLAYSTIANLGLIICCAGIGSSLAIGAAILLILFHAVSKALLFLCVGTVEQGIGSRDIEDMQGLMKLMPFTTIIMVLGMISMLLPPFGVLITKWIAMEAAVHLPVVLIMIICGSAFTVVFWAKWIGIILTMSYKVRYHAEKLTMSVKSSLSLLVMMVLSASIFIMPLYNYFIRPYFYGQFETANDLITGKSGLLTIGFNSLAVFGTMLLIVLLIPIFLRTTKSQRIKPPYLCGENTSDARGIEFTGPGESIDNVIVHNYYFKGIFGEENLTLWANFLAGAIILIMFGVVAY